MLTPDLSNSSNNIGHRKLTNLNSDPTFTFSTKTNTMAPTTIINDTNKSKNRTIISTTGDKNSIPHEATEKVMSEGEVPPLEDIIYDSEG